MKSNGIPVPLLIQCCYYRYCYGGLINGNLIYSSTSCFLPCREFARWKVRNTAIERRDLIRNPVPLMPEFQRSIRLLGRRPSTQQFIDTIIKKYGTHILISATLGGKIITFTSSIHLVHYSFYTKQQ